MKKLALTNSHLARGIEIHNTDKLILDSAKKKGLETLLVDPKKVNYLFNKNNFLIEFEDKNLLDYDVLLTRRTRGSEKKIYELVKSMEIYKKVTVDPSDSLIFPLNKYLSQIERKNTTNQPKTQYLPSLNNLTNSEFIYPSKLIKYVDRISNNWKFPFVLKPNEGKEGQGVEIIKNKQGLENYLYYNKSSDLLIQEYIPIDEEYRVLVIGNESLGICKKKTKSLIKNASKGSKFEYFRDKEIEQFAVNSLKNHKGDIYGVDIAKTKENKFYTIECNRSPNFISFREASKINVEDKIIDFCTYKHNLNK